MYELALHPSGSPSGAADACLFGLSLCAGAGGIDLGLTIACAGYCAVFFLNSLIQKMNVGACDSKRPSFGLCSRLVYE